MRLDHLLSMEKSGEKLHKSFCQNGLLARQADKEVLGRFAEQTHEYNEVVRMVFVNIFQRKVVSTTLFYFESLQAFAISI